MSGQTTGRPPCGGGPSRVRGGAGRPVLLDAGGTSYVRKRAARAASQHKEHIMAEATTRAFLDRLLTDGRARGLAGGVAGGAALGLAALLLGRNRAPRAALLLGGATALGRVALDAWGSRAAADGDDLPWDALPEDESEARAGTLLLAMVAAAKADGHVDEEEESAIHAEMEDAPDAVRALLDRALAAPADPGMVAARVQGPHEAREVYAASALLCGHDHPAEADYLDRLARALEIGEDEARRIERDLHAA